MAASSKKKPPEQFDAILERIMEGESLAAICRDEGVMDKRTFMRECIRNPEMAKRYADAMQIRVHLHAEEIIDIADQATSETYQESRLKIDTRKFILVHLLPEKYGEKVQMEHSGPGGTPIQVIERRIVDPLEPGTEKA